MYAVLHGWLITTRSGFNSLAAYQKGRVNMSYKTRALYLPWRQGRKIGRTIYAQMGPEPSDDDPLIGVMDTPDLAAAACEAHNELRQAQVAGGVS